MKHTDQRRPGLPDWDSDLRQTLNNESAIAWRKECRESAKKTACSLESKKKTPYA